MGRTLPWTQLASVALVLGVSACDEPLQPPVLEPESLISPETSDALASPTQFATAGCRMFIYDHGHRTVLQWPFSDATSPIGGAGSGPGEIGHAFAVASMSDTAATVVDWRRGRLLTWSVQHGLLRDIALTHHAARHAFVGPIIARPDGSVLDAPWGGRTSGTTIRDAVLDTAHLIYRIDSTGRSVAAWGRIDRLSDEQSGIARALHATGDLAMMGDTIVYLAFGAPELLFFALNAPSREPMRKVSLRRLRRQDQPVPRRVSTAGDSIERFEGPVFDASASSLAVSLDGTLAVTMRLADTPESEKGPDEGPWPRELLLLMRSDGTSIAEYALDGRETRSSGFLADNRYVRLYFADSTGQAGRVLGLYRLDTRDASGRNATSCNAER